MPNLKFFGLTGGIGSGKSTVARAFRELAINIVDADIIARDVVAVGQPTLAQIAEHFGPSVVLADGSLNRAKLRALIFSDSAQRHWLEALMHPVIRARIVQQLQQSTSLYTLLESPLLLETDQHRLVSRVIVVDIDEETQVVRASSRDAACDADIKRIIAAQMPRRERLSRANFIIDNSGTPVATVAQVRAVHQALSELASHQ